MSLALALSARGDDTSFIAQRGSALASRLGPTYLPWEEMDLRGFGGLRAIPRLVRRLRELAPDVVHVHEAASHTVAGIAARMAGKAKVVVTRRTASPLRGGCIRRLKYEQWCDRVVCVSKAVRWRCLEAGLPEELLVVVPDFVDCRHFDPEVAPSQDGTGPPTVAAVGRLTRGKGHAVLLRAMRQVVRTMPEARLLVGGEGEEEETLRRQAESEGLAQNVQFTGFVADVRGILSAARVVAMPSLEEGLGVVVLEAMAMAKPVLASDAGGLPETVLDGETGLVTPAGDANALADALVALLRDPGRARRMGRAGRERALAQFDRPRIVARVVEVYEGVLAEGRT
jgi:glycosyltransferase involved in cell wall biosynthesis